MIEKTPLEDWIRSKISSTKSTTLTAEEINAYHLRMLQKVVAYVREKSPFYRRHLIDFPRGAIRRLSDISTLPFTTEHYLRNDPLGFLCVPQGEIARIVTLRTSGTTGEPKRLFLTDEDLELTIDFFGCGMSTLVKAGQRVLILLPGEKPDSVGDLLARGLQRIGVEGIIHGPIRNMKAAADEIIGLNIDTLVGIPTQVLALARSKDGSAIKKGMIKSVLLSTDYVPIAIVNELNRLWGCSVFNHYGMTEMGLGGGVDCGALSGYHLREGDFYFEVVRPETGKPQAIGEIGEVVFTTLTRRGMPLIRYRTGDMARFIPELCPCGTVLRRMEHIRGRWDGMVQVGSSYNLSLPEIDEVLFGLPWLLNYSATLATQGTRTCLEISVFGEWGDRPKAEVFLKALKEVPAIRSAIAGGYLEVSPIRFVGENWFTTGTAKRRIIDTRNRRR